MSGEWSRPPVSRIARRGALGELGEKVGDRNGESLFVCLLPRHPGWLYKEYLTSQAADQGQRLDQLIGLPGQMSPADRSLVDAHTSWPAARVVDDVSQQVTTGVLIPLAPEDYKFTWVLPGQSGTTKTRTKVLDIDILALRDQEQQMRKIAVQSLSDRIRVCASIAAVADLFERHGLVYLDWSYANVFWSVTGHSAYVIDMDGASFGPRPQIQSPKWDDPLISLGAPAGTESDRYRVALLIARCLTGERGPVPETLARLGELQTRSAEVEHLAELLILGIQAPDPSERPRLAAIKAALDAAILPSPNGRAGGYPRPVGTAMTDRGGVVTWKPVKGNARPPVTAPGTPVQVTPQPRVTAQVPVTPPVWGRPPAPRAAGQGSGSPLVPQPSRPPAQPSGTSVAPVVKAALWIIAIIVFFVIILNV